MFLSELKLWNFRKYGVGTDDLDDAPPGVAAIFNQGLNVLIGENDSGKTALVDAIRHLLGIQSREWYRLDNSDFHGVGENRAKRLKIEAILRKFTRPTHLLVFACSNEHVAGHEAALEAAGWTVRKI